MTRRLAYLCGVERAGGIESRMSDIVEHLNVGVTLTRSRVTRSPHWFPVGGIGSTREPLFLTVVQNGDTGCDEGWWSREDEGRSFQFGSSHKVGAGQGRTIGECILIQSDIRSTRSKSRLIMIFKRGSARDESIHGPSSEKSQEKRPTIKEVSEDGGILEPS